MRVVWLTLLIVALASACSSASTTKGTPGAAPSSTAAADGSTTPDATPSAAAKVSPSPAIGTAIAVGTVVPIAAAGVDPAVAEEISVTIRHQIEALNAGKLDELYDLYSRCAKKQVTKEKLAFGRAATGTLTLLGINVLAANDRTAFVQIETQSLIFVGNQNHFKSKTNLVREDGVWKVDATNPAECGR